MPYLNWKDSQIKITTNLVAASKSLDVDVPFRSGALWLERGTRTHVQFLLVREPESGVRVLNENGFLIRKSLLLSFLNC